MLCREKNIVITVKTFFEQWIARFGAPPQIHTNQGRNFNSFLFTDGLKSQRHGRPSSNGQVELYDQMIIYLIRSYLNDKVTKWDEHLSALGMSLQATVNRSTGLTPNMLFLGMDVYMPEEIMFGLSTVNAQKLTPLCY